MTQLYQSKIFANGLTTLPKPVRDALGIKAGDRVRYVISEKGVQFFKIPLENAHADNSDLLNEFWSPKCGSSETKQCQLVIRPDVGVLWVGRVGLFRRDKKELLRSIL